MWHRQSAVYQDCFDVILFCRNQYPSKNIFLATVHDILSYLIGSHTYGVWNNNKDNLYQQIWTKSAGTNAGIMRPSWFTCLLVKADRDVTLLCLHVHLSLGCFYVELSLTILSRGRSSACTIRCNVNRSYRRRWIDFLVTHMLMFVPWCLLSLTLIYLSL